MVFLAQLTFEAWAATVGDQASVLGLFVSVIGFVITIITVMRSKSAALQAEAAAKQMRDQLSHYDAIADFATALEIMDEIKRLHRQEAWLILPDRYSNLRQRLHRIKGASPVLTEDHRQVLQGSLVAFADLEKTMERAIATKKTPRNPAKLNEIVSSEIDRLHVVLLALQTKLREVS